MKFKRGDLVYRSGQRHAPDPGRHTAGIGIIIEAFTDERATRVLWLNTGKIMISYNSLLSALEHHPTHRKNKDE
jgi:hypothetical protein